MSLLELKCKDDPEANGRKPKPGEQRFSLTFALENGDSLKLHMGREGMTYFETFIARMMFDDYAEREGLKERSDWRPSGARYYVICPVATPSSGAIESGEDIGRVRVGRKVFFERTPEELNMRCVSFGVSKSGQNRRPTGEGAQMSKQLCNADILTQKPEANTLWVGLTEDGREVVINHPEIRPDKDGAGYIVFSPDQARGLADLLHKHADSIDGGGSWKEVTRV